MTLWQMISGDLEGRNFKDKLSRRRLWTRSVHETIAERGEDGLIEFRCAKQPKRIGNERITTVRYQPFWDAIPARELDDALSRLARMAKGRR